MVYGRLDHPPSWTAYLQHPVFKSALAALAPLTPDSTCGITELNGPRMYVNVHTYETKPPEQCLWEAHRRMIDVQYVISGEEEVLWHPAAGLALIDYDETRDFEQRVRPPAAPVSVRLVPGSFAVFYPGEAHCPQRWVAGPVRLLKAVVKIEAGLLLS